LSIFRGAVLAAGMMALLQAGAHAQSDKIYRVGLVSVGAPDTGILGADMARNFARRGYVDGRNIVFERRVRRGRQTSFPGWSMK
jgi:hypothetical protein